MAIISHQSSQDCNRTMATTVARPKCVAPGCRSRPTFSLRVECGSCHGIVCMTHRHTADHACKGVDRLRRAPQLRAAGDVQNGGIGVSPLVGARSSAIQLTDTQTPLPRLAADHGPEQCPICAQSFEAVGDLIEHAEFCHSTSRRGEVEPLRSSRN